MKLIKYKFLSAEINHGTEEEPNIEQVFLEKTIECETQLQYDASYPVAEREAVGEITVEGAFDIVSAEEPTADDVLNALLGVTV